MKVQKFETMRLTNAKENPEDSMVYSSDLKSLHFLMGLILQKHLIMPIMVFI